MKRTLSLSTIILLFISVACLSTENQPKNSKTNGRWSAEKVHAWYDNQAWLIGCNFIPSTNIIRVYLHDMLWQQDSSGFMNRIDQFLAIAKKHNIKVMFVLLDSCWNPHPKLGKQYEPKQHDSTFTIPAGSSHHTLIRSKIRPPTVNSEVM